MASFCDDDVATERFNRQWNQWLSVARDNRRNGGSLALVLPGSYCLEFLSTTEYRKFEQEFALETQAVDAAALGLKLDDRPVYGGWMVVSDDLYFINQFAGLQSVGDEPRLLIPQGGSPEFGLWPPVFADRIARAGKRATVHAGVMAAQVAGALCGNAGARSSSPPSSVPTMPTVAPSPKHEQHEPRDRDDPIAHLLYAFQSVATVLTRAEIKESEDAKNAMWKNSRACRRGVPGTSAR